MLAPRASVPYPLKHAHPARSQVFWTICLVLLLSVDPPHLIIQITHIRWLKRRLLVENSSKPCEGGIGERTAGKKILLPFLSNRTRGRNNQENSYISRNMIEWGRITNILFSTSSPTVVIGCLYYYAHSSVWSVTWLWF